MSSCNNLNLCKPLAKENPINDASPWAKICGMNLVNSHISRVMEARIKMHGREQASYTVLGGLLAW